MRLEDYFNFLAPDDIRLKGTRIGIETILYYLHNKEAVEAYMTDWLEWGDRMRAEQQRSPRPVVERLRKLKAEKQANQMDHAQVSC
ncbi:DUF433 domain-containing protein [Coleofasciculus chthonoplastes]|uniref:DUF433 domain-containing protein n=1 Tax=Coleofasciculus chthonoplastes TaxID=64178 RepID=UPI0033014C06